MRAVVQRVKHAKVVVDGNTTGEIALGLLVLVGFGRNETAENLQWMLKKITQLRIFNDEAGKMNLSVQDVNGGLLLVSQFTLYADARKGNRPSFTNAAPPEVATRLYDDFVAQARAGFAGPVQTGIFGADMKVSLLNDGPVTILLDSDER
jgi:D-tyrosyl-tRNA(Tyr) deacylase